jgi:hypothetical protein
MAHENVAVMPRSDLIIEVAPLAQVPAAPVHVPAPTAERIEVINDVFTQNSEDRSAMGLLGIWGSVMLLHDLAAEHFARPTDDHEHRGTLPRPDDDPEPEPAV